MASAPQASYDQSGQLIPWNEPADLEGARFQRELKKWEGFRGDIITPEDLDPWLAYSDVETVSDAEKAAMIADNEPFAIVGINGPIDSDKFAGQYFQMATALPRLQSLKIVNVSYTGSNAKICDKAKPACAAGKPVGMFALKAFPSGRGNDFIGLVPYRPAKGQPKVSELKIS